MSNYNEKQEEIARKINCIFEVTRVDYEGVHEPKANALLCDLINQQVVQALDKLADSDKIHSLKCDSKEYFYIDKSAVYDLIKEYKGV